MWNISTKFLLCLYTMGFASCVNHNIPIASFNSDFPLYCGRHIDKFGKSQLVNKYSYIWFKMYEFGITVTILMVLSQIYPHSQSNKVNQTHLCQHALNWLSVKRNKCGMQHCKNVRFFKKSGSTSSSLYHILMLGSHDH